MSILSDLKKKSNKSFEKLKHDIDKEGKKDFGDERVWTPTKDKNGNAYAIIRFLGAPHGEDDDFVKLFTHGFKGPGGWYIENSLTTLGKDDPVGKFNSDLWNSNEDNDSPERKQARNQKRQLSYWTNILVVKDTGNPENDGKVFLFRFGPKILAKIKDKTHPENDIDSPINVFDYFNGANFRLKVKNIKTGNISFPSYDDSTFDSPSQISDSEKEIERIYKSCYSLQDIIDPKNFKTYDELKKRLDQVLKKSSFNQETPFNDEDDEDDEDFKSSNKRARDELDDDEIPFLKKKENKVDDDEEEDDLDFQKLLRK